MKKIKDLRVSWISLCKNPKTGLPLLKSQSNEDVLIINGLFTKASSDIVEAIVFKADTPDSDGHSITAEELQKSVNRFGEDMLYKNIDLEHNHKKVDAVITQSWFEKSDSSWRIRLKIQDNEVVNKIQKGEIKGVSLFGYGNLTGGDNIQQSNSAEKIQQTTEKPHNYNELDTEQIMIKMSQLEEEMKRMKNQQMSKSFKTPEDDGINLLPDF